MYFALAAADWAAVVVAACPGDAAATTAVPPTRTAARIRPAMRAELSMHEISLPHLSRLAKVK